VFFVARNQFRSIARNLTGNVLVLKGRHRYRLAQSGGKRLSKTPIFAPSLPVSWA
jgi:hypothetical protein